MLRLLRLLALVVLGVAAGFATAVATQWSTIINFSYSSETRGTITAPNGDIISVPRSSSTGEFKLNMSPYHEVSFDLFDTKGEKAK